MREDLQNKLYEKYPKIFVQKDLPMTQTAMCWGISCGDGWYDIIDTLCFHIQQQVDSPIESVERYEKILSEPDLEEANRGYLESLLQQAKSNIIEQVEAAQVKEKYGGLRFYVMGGNETVDALISFAEDMSYRTCESCGSPATPSEGGWITTRCNKCKGEI